MITAEQAKINSFNSFINNLERDINNATISGIFYLHNIKTGILAEEISNKIITLLEDNGFRVLKLLSGNINISWS